MRAVVISLKGKRTAIPSVVDGKRGRYYAFLHGEEGRGRWQYRLPLGARDFPVQEFAPDYYEEQNPYYRIMCRRCGKEAISKEFCQNCQEQFFAEQEYRLIPIKRDGEQLKDAAGNPLYLLGKGEADGKFLVFWYLSPGYRGSASYSIEGAARVIAEGREAQGAAGRMGGAPCPVVLVEGPCVLKWHRRGRLYGTPADWVARFDGNEWFVQPEDDAHLEDAVFGDLQGGE